MPARVIPQFLWVEKLYRDEERSVDFVVLDGTNPIVRNLGSTMIYHVVSGEGQFSVGERIEQVSAGDRVMIEAGMAYQDSGENLRMLAIGEPPHSPLLEQKLIKPDGAVYELGWSDY